MNTKDILSNKYIKSGLLLVAGLFLGWLFFHNPSDDKTTTASVEQAHDEHEHETWTCSMHPQIRMDEPGQCPICGMDLIPLQMDAAPVDDHAIGMSEAAMKLAEVQTSVVSRGGVAKELRLYGKIAPNEQLLQTQAAHVPGRIEDLRVNVTGEQVKRGQLLAKIYSPELVTAQKELLEALTLKDKYPSLLDAAREKLRNWKLSDKQIDELEQSGKVLSAFPIYANTSGIVTALKVNVGDYVSRGTVLFEVADLSTIWALFDAYESDIPWIKKGQTVEFTAQALPGETFSGKVSFIDPVVDAATRVARVRVEVKNPGLELKPEMFINGALHASNQSKTDELIIPQSAVLWTGTRSVVYVKMPDTQQPTFTMRQVTLGSALQSGWVVKDGLSEGEEIVTNGAFSVDAAAQLAGKPSMMNSEGASDTPTEGFPGSEALSKGEKTNGAIEGFTPSETLSKGEHTHRVIEGFTPSETLNKEHTMFKVSGNCDMCKDRIETAAKAVEGVLSANWEADKQMMHLQFDPKKTSADAVQKAIAAAGHDTEKHKAPDAVYNDLPECCLYR